MQANGWLSSILPALTKIHTNKNDLSKSMKQHLEFFNTHPFLVNFVQGIIIAMKKIKKILILLEVLKLQQWDH